MFCIEWMVVSHTHFSMYPFPHITEKLNHFIISMLIIIKFYASAYMGQLSLDRETVWWNKEVYYGKCLIHTHVPRPL